MSTLLRKPTWALLQQSATERDLAGDIGDLLMVILILSSKTTIEKLRSFK
jgi:hypothetical protein